MRTFTPEISWHNRLPALSLDISKPLDQSANLYRVATGGNDCRVYIWLIDCSSVSKAPTTAPTSALRPEIRIRAGLRRHQKSVGAVRFSEQHMLASGDDDGYIYLWRHKQIDSDQQQSIIESNAFLNDDGFEDLELWQQQRVLRGHIEDICDLAWSKDGQLLLSGSVDNSAILWDTNKGTKIWCSDLIKGYVQGVAFDPHGQFMAALSSDRALRIYNVAEKRLLYATRRMNMKGNLKAFFCDDTVQTFCRRLEFSPDGQFLIAPTSRMIEKKPKQAATSAHKAERPEEEPPQTDGIKKPADPEGTSTENNIEIIQIDDSNPADTSLYPEQANPEAPEPEKASDISVPMIADEPEEHDKSQTNKSDEQNENRSSQESSVKKPPKPTNVFLIFRRPYFHKPIHYYTTAREIALCARFSPVVYKLRGSESNFWGIPYRMVFAVLTARSVLIYDSQQPTPIGFISQIHLARLTDLAWSHDGRILMITSYDGYSTVITFGEDEFGELYTGPMLEPVTNSMIDELNTDDGEHGKPVKKGQKRAKAAKDAVATTAAKREKLNTESDSDNEDETKETKGVKRATPKKITPIKLPESATMWRFIVKKT